MTVPYWWDYPQRNTMHIVWFVRRKTGLTATTFCHREISSYVENYTTTNEITCEDCLAAWCARALWSSTDASD